jgi:hypothetical protein
VIASRFSLVSFASARRNQSSSTSSSGLCCEYDTVKQTARSSCPADPLFWLQSRSQYAVMRPLLSIIGIVCEAFGNLCPEQYSVYFAEVYIEAADFVSSLYLPQVSVPMLTGSA